MHCLSRKLDFYLREKFSKLHDVFYCFNCKISCQPSSQKILVPYTIPHIQIQVKHLPITIPVLIEHILMVGTVETHRNNARTRPECTHARRLRLHRETRNTPLRLCVRAKQPDLGQRRPLVL